MKLSMTRTSFETKPTLLIALNMTLGSMLPEPPELELVGQF